MQKDTRVQDTKTGNTGTVISTGYRRSGNRSLPQARVRWDKATPSGDREWNVLTRNLVRI